MARNIMSQVGKVRNIRLPKLPDLDTSTPDVFEEMTLQEHLEELRDRIIKSLLAIVPAFIFGFAIQGSVLNDIKNKANATEKLQNLSPIDTFTISFQIALYIALAITMPVIIYQITAFLMPGMTKREKRFFLSAMPFVTILFVSGCLFGYFVAAPKALYFLSTWNQDAFAWQPTGELTVNFMLKLMIGLGLAFQLPVLMFIFAKLGIITPKKMRAWRKWAFLLLLIAAAMITPTPDPFNMAFVAVPLMLLYELGIIISSIFARTSFRSSGTDDDGDAKPPKEKKAKSTTPALAAAKADEV